jgi:glyoxylase-like metal-dependent hydrolase (beta-lactamase superfamily II)
MPIAQFSLGPLETNCYLLHDDVCALAVDPGGEPDEVIAFLKKRRLKLLAILNTHLHFDHILGNAALHDATGAPVRVPDGDGYLRTSELGGGGRGVPKAPAFDGVPLPAGEHDFGPFHCAVLHTPGHTLGSLCFHMPAEASVFVGDLIFYRSVGRTDLPGGDERALLDSIRRHILALPDGTRLYPGHGPATTVGDERRNNPFCGVFGG